MSELLTLFYNQGKGKPIGKGSVGGGSVPVVTPWYLEGGVSLANCIGAYRAKGAASQAASYINLPTPGTHNIIAGLVYPAGTAPPWDTTNGWKFAGNPEVLATDITPENDQTWSAIIKGDGFSNIGGGNYLFGTASSGGGGLRPYFTYNWASGLAGNGDYITAGAGTSGVFAIAGNRAYLNGTIDADTIATFAGTFGAIYLGCMNNGGAGGFFCIANIHAFAIYDVALTPTQVAAITTAMGTL